MSSPDGKVPPSNLSDPIFLTNPTELAQFLFLIRTLCIVLFSPFSEPIRNVGRGKRDDYDEDRSNSEKHITHSFSYLTGTASHPWFYVGENKAYAFFDQQRY